MAIIEITIPTQYVTRVTHALSVSAGKPDSAANARQALIDHIKATVRNVEQSEAEQAALDSIVEPDVTGVAV